MSEIGDFEYSELWIKLAKVEAENERLQIALSGMQKAVSQLHEAIDAIERLGTALIEKK